MSYGVKYRCVHMDITGVTWRVDLLVDGYTGAILEPVPGGMPILISTLGEGDGEGGIKAREWVVEFLNMTSFQYMEIFTGTARDYLCQIYKNDVLIGSGWCDPDNYSEEFVSGVYPSKIHVHDGLGELKNIYYSMPDNPGGDFHRSVIGFIGEALAATGILLPLYIAQDITFKKKDGTEVTTQTLPQLYVDWRLFRTGEDSWWSYYDIVSSIINSFEGMRLFQEAGAWWIDRAGTIKAGNYTVDKYSAGEDPEYTGSVSKDPVQALTSNSIGQDKICRFGSDCELTIVPPWKRFSIVHNYGVKENILKARSLLGTFFPDDWQTDEDLWYWTRSNVNIIKNDDGSFRIPGLLFNADLYPPYSNFLQSNSVAIDTEADVIKLRQSWGDTPMWVGKGTHVGMKLSVRYFLRASAYFAQQETLRLFLRVSLQDADGNVWNTLNTYTDPLSSDHVIEPSTAWFDPEGTDPSAIIEVNPVVNEWAEAEFLIPNCALRGDEDGLAEWSFRVKIYPAMSSLGTGNPDLGDGLIISGVKLGFYDRYNMAGVRTITEKINEKNRYVPSDINVSFGETPGHWGSKLPFTGQEFMDKFIFMDSDGKPITEFGTVAAGLGTGGLVQGIMTSSLQLKHKLPLFKIRGSVRDNPSNVDFCSALQDYDGRIYVPTGMDRDVGMAEVQAEWVQVRLPEQEEGGEFNWDFSNDFNI